ncbi:putative carrier protein [Trypanosoma vivax]|uniref:Putative mitochondrial carrier protein n=1 Tax=Trypanosoma vivax (strain Y486) TaxID=1055687 RepID=G0U0R9_TRYVY|nr:putative carrier protein [Trypanosoma vivax]CCC49669.1 putative mitochondrial carrier protein [Trypanosoma vivax Y486]
MTDESTADKTHSKVLMASTCATMLTKSLLHPIDTVKCRIQSSKGHSLGTVFREYRGKWGVFYVYGGLPAKLVFSVPYQAIYMTSYNAAKRAMEVPDATAQSSVGFLLRTILAACIAELTSCVVRVPMETAKMRIQSGVVSNTAAALLQIRQQGYGAFFRMIRSQTFLHDIPYSVTQWIIYETLRPWAQEAWSGTLQSPPAVESGRNTHSKLKVYAQNFMRTFVAGGFSAFIASLITVPLDVTRTRVVVAASMGPNVRISTIVREMYKVGGARIFFRGAPIRVLWVTSNLALYFPIYELLSS